MAKLSDKDPNRELRVGEAMEDDVFILIERERTERRGYNRARWDETRISISAAEVEKLAKFVREQMAKVNSTT